MGIETDNIVLILGSMFIYLMSFFIVSTAQNKQSYQIFNQNGTLASYENIINSSQKSDVLLFGEYHDNSVAHWLELEITKQSSLIS